MKGMSVSAIAVNPAKRSVALIPTEQPAIASDTDVRVRILDVGVCGTDKEICAFEYGTPPLGRRHLVIGHESLGEVTEVGVAARRRWMRRELRKTCE